MIDIKPRSVFIKSLTIAPPESANAPSSHPLTGELGEGKMIKTTFECVCGKGTYVRSLARDMGLRLGCYGYISNLQRTQVGPFTLENAISLDILESLGDKAPENTVLPVETVLDDIPALALKDQEAARLKQGQKLSFIAKPDLERMRKVGIEREDTALATYNGKAIALVGIDGPVVSPLRVLNH